MGGLGRPFLLLTMVRMVSAVLIGVSLLAATLAERDQAFIGKRANWWAFQKPVRHTVPRLNDAWVRTPVDAFLLEAMRASGLSPSAELGKAALLRRVTLDLTGLPPTGREVDAFLSDRSPDAYTKVVDRLLGSPRYGERWAMRWLDVVRYADTNGYEIDAEPGECLAVSRLRHSIVQSGQALRPVPARAVGGG